MSHERFKSCIDACYTCAAECDHCATACLKEDDVKMMEKCIELDMYCADICRMAAAFMARSDAHTLPFTMQICRLCAEICQACGNECSQHKHDHCLRCAEACFACAEQCLAMAA